MRPTWTTPEQKEWLEPRKAAFIEAKQKGNAALKEYFNGVFKEFRVKWPVEPVTNLEIAGAGNAELAAKKKREKYDQRLREWFHNNTRSLASTGVARSGGILKMKAKPRMLQGWQAYHAMTYETKWKPHIAEAWEKYKKEWESEHTIEKPPKNRFTIMVEFMKEKFKNETDDVKRQCEEYRMAHKSESPVPDSVTERNLNYQAAIDKLPHTLATIGTSIMEQTGWQITIMAGGPSPDHDGMIMTYLSHSGKTKEGETYEKFLGSKEYDEKLLSFEKFLHASFSAEECASRSLVKEDSVVDEMPGGDTKAGPSDNQVDDVKVDDGEAENKNERKVPDNKVDDGETKNKNERAHEANSEKGSDSKSEKRCKYLEDKEKNKAELRKLLQEVKEQYPLAEDPIAAGLRKEKEGQRPASKIKGGSDEPAVRRVSERNKDKSATVTPASLTEATPTVNPVDQPSPPVDASAAQTLPLSANEPAPSSQESTPPNVSQSTVVEQPSGSISPPAINPLDTSKDADSSSDAVTGTAGTNGSPTANSTSQPTSSLGLVDATAINKGGDVVMQDAPSVSSSEPRNDENLPTWLAQMIAYLRRVSEDVAWQDLITEFVDFEKHGPPGGNLSTKQRPREISDWIRSKKKDTVPPIEVSSYGKAFKDWWLGMQPFWRNRDGLLVRDAPPGENWQMLRKGGTAGMYVVVIGLSWWVQALDKNGDIEAWTLVDDVSWVLQQLKKTAVLAVSVPQKRARGSDDGGEDSQRKTRRRSK